MDWHRLFGLFLTDFFTGSPFIVLMEKDLSLKVQWLDVVILRRSKGRITEPLPDGFADLADHNLVTFKSHQEPLDDWALKELTGHYVNYRKQLAEDEAPLLPESAFRLYAICSRFPHNLAQEVALTTVQAGVYDCRRGTDQIRVVVAGQVPKTANNALLHLLSASPAQWRFGTQHYRQRSATTSSLISRLFEVYEAEGIHMPYTMDDFVREFTLSHIKDLTPAQRQKALMDLKAAERRAASKDFSPAELLAGLSPEQLEQVREVLNADLQSAKPKKRRRK